MQTLRDRLDARLDHMAAGSRPTPVNALRAEVLAACRSHAADPTGIFSLTVPTGGGKTLSGMSFALSHAVAKSLRRVIVVVPYTSIIEQNAAIYRDYLGADNVVEHHSNLDDFTESDCNDEQALRRRWACENWDAPVIVTTNVQFFESLFAHKKSRCRKLHNICRSVIVLDEAQSLPIGFLQPVLDALHELATNYGSTVMLCTATQPALGRREALPEGLHPIAEIISNPSQLGDQLRRVSVHWPAADERTPYEELAGQLACHRAVLAVVHRRLDASRLTRLVQERCPGEALFHLSALMCPVHRRETIEAIRGALVTHREQGAACRVVSTQLVEAGVDLDFPVVYRALAGLDSIAQAAGRCNREGLLTRGEVFVFRAETEPPGPTLQRALGQTCSMLEVRSGDLDITDPNVFQEYFRRFYANEELDARAIRRELTQLNFATVGETFRLIEDDYQRAVVIPWDNLARKRIEKVRALDQFKFDGAERRAALRGLQPYTVQIQPRHFDALNARGALEPLLDETVWILNIQLFPNAYNDQLGLVVDDETSADAAALVV
jgi:CRISPR-associated endonuclease/helicase Cas3